MSTCASCIGKWDVGLAHFSGTGREPVLRPDAGRSELVLTPLYPQIHQPSLDLQVTHGPILGKLEALSRREFGDRFEALTGGVEYTFASLGRSKWDFGLLAEYLYDGRRDRSTAPFQNDLFLGARFALNDTQSTEILAGGVIDLASGGTVVRVEASRRLGVRWKLGIRGWAFAGLPRHDPLHALRQDDFVQIELSRYF